MVDTIRGGKVVAFVRPPRISFIALRTQESGSFRWELPKNVSHVLSDLSDTECDLRFTEVKKAMELLFVGIIKAFWLVSPKKGLAGTVATLNLVYEHLISQAPPELPPVDRQFNPQKTALVTLSVKSSAFGSLSWTVPESLAMQAELRNPKTKPPELVYINHMTHMGLVLMINALVVQSKGEFTTKIERVVNATKIASLVVDGFRWRKY